MFSMRMKAVVAGLGAMTVLGGGVALAAAAGAAPNGFGPFGGGGHPRVERLLDLRAAGELGDRFLHTDTTYVGKDDATMTVSAISGSVTEVSATSITVTAADGVAKTYAVDGDTIVKVVDPDADPKIADGAIGDIQAGDSVVVSARGPAGTDAPATRILVRP